MDEIMMKFMIVGTALVCSSAAFAANPVLDGGLLKFDDGHDWLVQTAWSSENPRAVDVCSNTSSPDGCQIAAGDYKWYDWTDGSSGKIQKNDDGQVFIDGKFVSSDGGGGVSEHDHDQYMTEPAVRQVVDEYDFDMKAEVEAYLESIGFECDLE